MGDTYAFGFHLCMVLSAVGIACCVAVFVYYARQGDRS